MASVYTPDATNSAQPADTDYGYLAAAELRTLKSYIQSTIIPALSGGSSATPSVLQTVLSGPVDSAGLPSFGGSTGATTLTCAGTIKATAAAGSDTHRVGSITNPNWTGLSTNGTMYLYLEIASNGTVTTGSTTLAPTYQFGGTYSTTNGQHTYNIQEMTMRVGNGSAATQVYRVFIGEVTVAAGVVSAITWYAIMGQYEAAWTNTLPGASTAISKNHNIGIYPKEYWFEMECITTDSGYAVGDRIRNPLYVSSSSFGNLICSATSKVVATITGNSSAIQVLNKSTGAVATPTAANWKYRLCASRGW